MQVSDCPSQTAEVAVGLGGALAHGTAQCQRRWALCTEDAQPSTPGPQTLYDESLHSGYTGISSSRRGTNDRVMVLRSRICKQQGRWSGGWEPHLHQRLAWLLMDRSR